MLIGLMRLHVRMPANRTLKDRRRVVQSFLSKVRNRHNISIVELEEQSLITEGIFGVVFFAGSKNGIEKMFENVEKLAILSGETEIVSIRKDVLEIPW